MSSDVKKGEYIIEFQQHGPSVKVSAIDPVTMTEVSIIGPSSASQAELQKTAVQKLLFVLEKKKSDPQEETSQTPNTRPGIIV